MMSRLILVEEDTELITADTKGVCTGQQTTNQKNLIFMKKLLLQMFLKLSKIKEVF